MNYKLLLLFYFYYFPNIFTSNQINMEENAMIIDGNIITEVNYEKEIINFINFLKEKKLNLSYISTTFIKHYIANKQKGSIIEQRMKVDGVSVITYINTVYNVKQRENSIIQKYWEHNAVNEDILNDYSVDEIKTIIIEEFKQYSKSHTMTDFLMERINFTMTDFLMEKINLLSKIIFNTFKYNDLINILQEDTHKEYIMFNIILNFKIFLENNGNINLIEEYSNSSLRNYSNQPIKIFKNLRLNMEYTKFNNLIIFDQNENLILVLINTINKKYNPNNKEDVNKLINAIKFINFYNYYYHYDEEDSFDILKYYNFIINISTGDSNFSYQTFLNLEQLPNMHLLIPHKDPNFEIKITQFIEYVKFLKENQYSERYNNECYNFIIRETLNPLPLIIKQLNKMLFSSRFLYILLNTQKTNQQYNQYLLNEMSIINIDNDHIDIYKNFESYIIINTLSKIIINTRYLTNKMPDMYKKFFIISVIMYKYHSVLYDNYRNSNNNKQTTYSEDNIETFLTQKDKDFSGLKLTLEYNTNISNIYINFLTISIAVYWKNSVNNINELVNGFLFLNCFNFFDLYNTPPKDCFRLFIHEYTELLNFSLLPNMNVLIQNKSSKLKAQVANFTQKIKACFLQTSYENSSYHKDLFKPHERHNFYNLFNPNKDFDKDYNYIGKQKILIEQFKIINTIIKDSLNIKDEYNIDTIDSPQILSMNDLLNNDEYKIDTIDSLQILSMKQLFIIFGIIITLILCGIMIDKHKKNKKIKNKKAMIIKKNNFSDK